MLYFRRKSPWHPGNRKLCGPGAVCTCWRSRKYIFPPPRIETRFLRRPVRNLDTTPTKLSRRWVSKNSYSVYTIGRLCIETETLYFTFGFRRTRPDVCCWHQKQGKSPHTTLKQTQILSLHRTSLGEQLIRTSRNRIENCWIRNMPTNLEGSKV